MAIQRKQEWRVKPLILLRHPTFAIIAHWSIVLLLTLGIITGIYIGNPFLETAVPMRYIRVAHLLGNSILSAIIVSRVYYAVISGDIRNFLPRRGDVRRFINLMAYYLFIRPEKPYDSAKYNVGQRLIYSSWVFVWLFHTVTGIILLYESQLAFAAKYFGGLQTIRLFRYLLAVYFVVTILIHVYLALTSDPAKLQSIFSGYIRVKDGEDE